MKNFEVFGCDISKSHKYKNQYFQVDSVSPIISPLKEKVSVVINCSGAQAFKSFETPDRFYLKHEMY